MASGSSKCHIASCPSSLSRWWQFLCRSCWLGGAWGQFALMWHKGHSSGLARGLALVSLLAVGRQGQCYAVCVYTPAQCAPQPPVALKGEAPMSLMYSVPARDVFPAHLPTGWVCGEEGPGRVAFRSVSVMVRPLIPRAGPVAVQERSPRLLPELWQSYPC